MKDPLRDVLDILELENLERNLFRGHGHEVGWERVFGGQVLGQALVAAGRTVEERPAHSFHGYFLRPGDPQRPILYRVDRSRDGRSFSTRRVVAIQNGQPIFHMEASFHLEEEGPVHQFEKPEAPEPEGLPTQQERVHALAEMAGEEIAWLTRERAIDVRYATPVDPVAPGRLPARMRVWIRVAGDLPDTPALHRCLAAYASDLLLIDAIGLPHGMDARGSGYQLASLDHAMWFHRPFRADRWLLYEVESPTAAGGRGLASGRLFTREGALAASVIQEGLMRYDRKDR